jgi:Ca2+-binding RTX toxin-like protein
MAVFIGNTGNNLADAVNGVLEGFTGGTLDELQDMSGDRFNGCNGDDTIKAGPGDDTINGGDGDDMLSAGAGNDLLILGIGTDTLFGGAGDDTIRAIDNAWTGKIDGGAGIDTLNLSNIASQESYFDLAGGVWTLSSGGFPGIQGIERIIGTQMLDRIEGSGADETFNGGAGDDVLIGMGGADILIGGEGADRLYGVADADHLFGGAADDTLDGGSENDRLDGGLGHDSLWGGLGRDHFVFTAELDFANFDRIGDFTVSDDTVFLDSDAFAGLTRGLLAAEAFHIGSAASDADHRIIYDSTTGALFFDGDGAGGAAKVKFAQFSGGLALTNHDFVVI